MNDILYLVNADGTIQGVQLSADLWKKVESSVRACLEKKEEQLTQKQGPLNDFKVLMQFWDFAYPYVPEVKCPNCGAETKDWLGDTNHTFILTNANLGGLLVFHCSKCGTTIRHKHFKDHVAYEYTVPSKE